MLPTTFKSMVINLLCKQLKYQDKADIFHYLKDNENNYHKVCKLDLYDCKTKCEDGYYDYNEYIIEDEGIHDRLFCQAIIRE